MRRFPRAAPTTRALAIALAAAVAVFALASVVHLHGLGGGSSPGRKLRPSIDAGAATPLGSCIACQAAHVQIQVPDAPAVAPAVAPSRSALASEPASACRAPLRDVASRAPPATSFPSI